MIQQQVEDPYRIDPGLHDRLMGIYLVREQQMDEFIAAGRLSAESQETLLEAAAMALSDIRELPFSAVSSLQREAKLFKKCIDDFDAIIKTIEQSENIAGAAAVAGVTFEADGVDDEPAEDVDG